MPTKMFATAASASAPDTFIVFAKKRAVRRTKRLDPAEVVERSEEAPDDHDDRQHAEGEASADVEQRTEHEARARLRDVDQEGDRPLDEREEDFADRRRQQDDREHELERSPLRTMRRSIAARSLEASHASPSRTKRPDGRERAQRDLVHARLPRGARAGPSKAAIEPRGCALGIGGRRDRRDDGDAGDADRSQRREVARFDPADRDEGSRGGARGPPRRRLRGRGPRRASPSSGCRRRGRRRRSRRLRRGSRRAARAYGSSGRRRALRGRRRASADGGRSSWPRWTASASARSARSKRSFTTKRLPAGPRQRPDLARPGERRLVARVFGAQLHYRDPRATRRPRLLDRVASPARIVVDQHVEPAIGVASVRAPAGRRRGPLTSGSGARCAGR